MSSSNSLMQVPILKSNYDKWSLKMEALLGSQECWDIVKEGYVDPDFEQVGESSPGSSTSRNITGDEMKFLKSARKKTKQALYLL